MHIHWGKLKDYNSQWSYVQCRCGAKATIEKKNPRGFVPRRKDWPEPGTGWHHDYVGATLQAVPRPPKGPGGANKSSNNAGQ